LNTETTDIRHFPASFYTTSYPYLLKAENRSLLIVTIHPELYERIHLFPSTSLFYNANTWALATSPTLTIGIQIFGIAGNPPVITFITNSLDAYMSG
jgi:hypothetical protein